MHCSCDFEQVANFVSAHAFVYSKVGHHGTTPLSCFLMTSTCLCGSVAQGCIQPMCTGGRQSSKHLESSCSCICRVVGCPQCRCSPLTYATCRVKCIRQPCRFSANSILQWISLSMWYSRIHGPVCRYSCQGCAGSLGRSLKEVFSYDRISGIISIGANFTREFRAVLIPNLATWWCTMMSRTWMLVFG